MRKKCIAIAKKAMVWALAASMLVATPLTASAAGLRGVYSTTDGSGTTWDTGDPSRTGTVTTTNSNTGVLTNEAKITGISINPSDIQLELDGEPARGKNQKVVTAKILGTVEGDELKKLQSKLIWRVKNTDIATVDAKAGDRTTAYLTPWKGGETVVEVTLDDYEKNIHFKAEAKVSVKEYTQNFSLAVPAGAKLLVNHTLDLNKLISGRVPGSANDTFTFGITPDVKGGATINAANVVTFKKVCNVEVVVVSEKGLAKKINLDVKEGTKSRKVTLHKIGADGKPLSDEYKKETLDIATDANRTVVVQADLDPADSTDTVAWTSNKSDIVEVESVSADTKQVTLKLKKVGKATITAKASSGKSAKVALTVQASLKGLTIKDINKTNTVYTGQTIQLEVERDPAENTDALKWTTTDSKIASVNAKGILTIKNTVKYDDNKDYAEVAIQAVSKKNSSVTSNVLTLKVKQNKLNGFSVYEGSNTEMGTLLLAVGADGKQSTKGKKSTLNIPQNKTYTATATDADGTLGLASTLNWTSSNTKVASVVKDNTGKAVITPLKKGNATITVSGVMEITKKNKSSLKLVKATFKVEVKQPTTTLKMNKPEVTVKNTGKKQNVSFSVKQNANAKEIISWNVVQTEGEKANITWTSQKGKVTLEKDGYKAGDKFEVTATAESGVTAKATISVVDATNKVVIAREFKDGVPEEYTYQNAKGKDVKKATTLAIGSSIELKSYIETTANKNKNVWVEAGDANTATVTYTANKKGVVQIVGNKVTRLASGSVTITAKTSDGKSYKLKLEDPVVK